MKQTQIMRIMQFMRQFGEITQRDAFFLGCQRLASRIHDIKQMGVKIKTETRKVENVDGSHSYIAVYSIIEEVSEDGGEENE